MQFDHSLSLPLSFSLSPSLLSSEMVATKFLFIAMLSELVRCPNYLLIYRSVFTCLPVVVSIQCAPLLGRKRPGQKGRQRGSNPSFQPQRLQFSSGMFTAFTPAQPAPNASSTKPVLETAPKIEPASETKTEPASETKTEPASETKTEPASETKTAPAIQSAAETVPLSSMSSDPMAMSQSGLDGTGSWMVAVPPVNPFNLGPQSETPNTKEVDTPSEVPSESMAEDSGEPVDTDEEPDVDSQQPDSESPSESPPSSSAPNPDLINGSELDPGNVMKEITAPSINNMIQRKDLSTVTRSLETVVKQLYRVFKFLKCLSELTT